MPAGVVPGALVGGYRIESRIGVGGMAVVFRAYDQALGRTVALKVLAPALAGDAEFRERFIRESRAAAVDHPHIIPVYAAGDANGVLYLAMRFVPGGDLRALLGREGRLPGDRVIALLSPIASALDVAHAAGLVHRDVKPANILVDAPRGSSEHPYLADFGLVKEIMAAGGLTGTGQFIGTLNYVAPEQISGKPARPQTDQYALACVAYSLFTGSQPFARVDSAGVLWAHMYDAPPSVVAQSPGQPPAVDEVLAKALAKSPDDRFDTCADFIDALRAALSANPPADSPRVDGTGPHPETIVIPVPAQPEAVVPQEAVQQAPAGSAEAMTATMTVQQSPGEAGAAGPVGADAAGRSSDVRTDPIGAAVSGQPVPEPPRRRRRWLIMMTVAAFALVVGFGTLLALHPWTGKPVPAPTGLTVKSETEDGSGASCSVEIAWSGPATGPLPDDYEIFRDGNQVGTVLGTKTSFTDTGLTPGTPYGFQVVAVKGASRSPVSATLTARTPPLSPTGLGVAHASTNSLQVTWSGPAAGPAPGQYEIFRDGSKVATVPGSATSYTDAGLAPDTAYSYQVIAVTGHEQSAASSLLPAARTAKPPLADAVLNWGGEVNEKAVSIEPAWPAFAPQPGSSTENAWTFSPDCSSGPCGVTLNGTADYYAVTANLTRSGATYKGTAKLANDFYCTTKSDSYSGTITISITVRAAQTQAGVWTATSFSGEETIYAPETSACNAQTVVLAVTGG